MYLRRHAALIRRVALTDTIEIQMLPPLLSDLRQSLLSIPEPRSDAQDALLAELHAVDRGEPVAHADVARSLGGSLSVCPMCQRPFAS